MNYNLLNTSGLRQLALAACFAGCIAVPLTAQIIYDVPDATIVEDFNTGLPSAASTPAWADNSVFTGWYAYQTATSGAPTSYRITSSGNSSAARLYQWRPSAASSEGAFGTRPSGTTGSMILGLQLTNDTGVTLTSFSLGYVGQQWFESESTQNNQFVVSYQFGDPTDLNDGVWTVIPELEFNSPKDSGADQNLDGTLPENQETLAPATITSISWEDGEDLWIRWFDANSAGFDQGIAIDDVTFTAVPEPSAYSLLVGLLAVALVWKRRSVK
ncbi:MAG: PEP-CTERM sorting domain-containing protein [Verrucomicrobiota bacterium]